jgi:hypothetical protein
LLVVNYLAVFRIWSIILHIRRVRITAKKHEKKCPISANFGQDGLEWPKKHRSLLSL